LRCPRPSSRTRAECARARARRRRSRLAQQRDELGGRRIRVAVALGWAGFQISAPARRLRVRGRLSATSPRTGPPQPARKRPAARARGGRRARAARLSPPPPVAMRPALRLHLRHAPRGTPSGPVVLRLFHSSSGMP
jgi:hypothetical protein